MVLIGELVKALNLYSNPEVGNHSHVNKIVSETVKPPMSEIVKPIEVSSSRKIRVDLKESKPKKPTLSKDKTHDKPT